MNRTSFALACVIAYGVFFVHAAEAFTPSVIATPSQNEVMPLPHPTVSQAFHGNLEGYPHMFEFYTKAAMPLRVEILVPDLAVTRNDVSGIILKVNKNGSVTEIARLSAKDAEWSSFFEPWGGDSYRRGGLYEGDIEPGLYRIEASTPDNMGKYALVVGTESHRMRLGYFGLIGEMMEVKVFFGKSKAAVLWSPLVYGPALVLLSGVGGGLWFFFRRRKRRLIDAKAKGGGR